MSEGEQQGGIKKLAGVKKYEAFQKLVQMASGVPGFSPDDPFWDLSSEVRPAKSGGLLGMFKKGAVPFNVQALRQDAMKSPATTNTKVMAMREKYPDDPDLEMIQDIIAFGMLHNETNPEVLFEGMRDVAKKAAAALIHDGISVFNSEQFVYFYFTYLQKLKAKQYKVLRALKDNQKMEAELKEVNIKLKENELLLAESQRIQAMLRELRKKANKEMYTKRITSKRIKAAVALKEKDRDSEHSGYASAKFTLDVLFKLANIFARIPLLSPLLDIIRETTAAGTSPYFKLKTASTMTVYRILTYKAAMLSGNRKKMTVIGAQIFQTNSELARSRIGQPVSFAFEADPFFNTYYVTEMLSAIDPDGHAQRLEFAKECLKNLIGQDVSQSKIFSERAAKYNARLKGS